MRVYVRMNRIWLALLVVFALVIEGNAVSQQQSSWKDLPPLVFQDCISLTQRVAPVPHTPVRNDFLVVTAYEERPELGRIEKDETYVNMYLVGALFLTTNSMSVYYNSQLIVDRLVYDAEMGTVTDYKWILSDKDRDGVLDNAAFRTIVRDALNHVLNEDTVAIPENQLIEMQKYYEEAVNRFQEKRKADSMRMCIAA